MNIKVKNRENRIQLGNVAFGFIYKTAIGDYAIKINENYSLYLITNSDKFSGNGTFEHNKNSYVTVYGIESIELKEL